MITRRSRTPNHEPPNASPKVSIVFSDPENGTRRDGAALIRRGRALLRELVRGTHDNAKAQRTALNAFAIRVLAAVIVYGTQILIARFIGEKDYGIYVFVWSCVLIFGGISSLGFSISIARFVPEYRERGETALLRGAITTTRWLPVLIASIGAAAGAAIVYFAGSLIASPYVLPLFLGLICIPAYAMSDGADGVSRAHNWINLALVPIYLVRPLLLLALMIAAYASGVSIGADTALYAAVAACWLTAVIQYVLLSLRLKREIPAGPRAYRIKTWVGVSAPIFLVESFFYLMTHTDVLMLSLLRSPEEVGIYYAAVKTLALVSFVHFAVAAASAHKFSEYYARNDHGRLEAFARNAVHWTFWPSLLGIIGLLILGQPLLSLFGEGFTVAYPVMFVFAIGLLARAAIGPAERLLNVVGKEGLCAKIYAGAFAFNIAANVLLIPHWGIYGAAAATSAAYILESILLVWAVKRGLGLSVMLWDKPAPEAETGKPEEAGAAP